MTYNNLNNLNKNCTICLSSIKDFFKKTYKTSCNHKFHKKCIRKWLKNKKTCPLCNHKEEWINPDSFLRISGY